MELTNLAQYGITGVCLALIGAIVFIVRKVLNVVANHINHNTEVTAKLCEKMDRSNDNEKEMRKILLGINGYKK